MKNNEKFISGAESIVLIICTFEIDQLNSSLETLVNSIKMSIPKS